MKHEKNFGVAKVDPQRGQITPVLQCFERLVREDSNLRISSRNGELAGDADQ
jgi:hypothetical protein